MNPRDALVTAGEIGYSTHPDERGYVVMPEAVHLVVRRGSLPREVGGQARDSRRRL